MRSIFPYLSIALLQKLIQWTQKITTNLKCYKTLWLLKLTQQTNGLAYRFWILWQKSILLQKQPQRRSVKIGVLRNFAKFTGKHLCQSLFFKKEALAQMFSCEFWEISKNTFFTEHLWTTASAARSIK